MARAMRWTCSSLSMTQGPAIKPNGESAPKRMEPSSIASREFDIPQQGARHAPLSILVSCRNERPEQRVRLERLRFELRMKLASKIPGVVFDFADLHVGAVRSLSRNSQPGRRQQL